MLGFIKKMIGTKSDKDIKKVMPLVDEINLYFEEYDKLSEEELKHKTVEFKEIVKEASNELETEKKELRDKLINEALDAKDSQAINDRLKEIEKELFEVIDETLDDILPQAFATVKQACKRLKEQKYSYEYAGTKYIWDMVPFDVQLIGGITLHQGKIAEMATGEGKTLVAIMPMYLNALSGKGVHLVTVNDYLAKRDCDWMRPVYEYLGLKVGAIQANMDSKERRRLYNYDITYGTNNEFGFDYLRDNMVVDEENLVQRPHWFSIVDEVDSVLIDEARTPLIISGPVGQTDQKFDQMNPRVKRLVDVQNRLVNKILGEATELLKSEKKEDREAAGEKLFMAHRGLPKHKRLLKLMQEPENIKLRQETEMFYLREQGKRLPEIDEQLYYVIEEKNHSIDITDKGREILTQSSEDKDTFVLPDIAAELSALEVDESLSAAEKQKKEAAIHVLYSERSDRVHTISQLLKAHSLYERDVEYVIQDGKVQIVDEFTGRILDGRRYSDGLHQAIEAKEHVKVERDTQTFATVTLQNYFRLYKKRSGMTGTAETEAAEFDKIYSMDVVVVPSNRPIQRKDENDLIYKTKREKYNAIIDDIQEELNNGRAILVGTASVDVSEVLSKMLRRAGIKHNVLNAKHHSREAEIVATAGKKGAVTIATNMAGRGTDIKLDHDVKENGGLAIIGSERHDARRIDRQLRGRAGRQGDPGSSRFFISLEDNLMRLFGGERIASVMQRLKIPEGEPIEHSMITKSVERAQKKVEENNFGIRKRLLDYDNVMNQQREVIYARRRQALRGERLKGELFDYIEDLAGVWYDEFHPEKDVKGIKDVVRSTLLCEVDITEDNFESMKVDECVQKILDAADEFYTRKEEMTGSEFMAKLERVAVLQTIDDKWREHLRVMDDLKEGIHLRAYAQKDPLLEYKGEAYKIFVDLIADINKGSIQFAFKYFPQIVEKQVRVAQGEDGAPVLKRSSSAQNLSYQKPQDVPSYAQQQQQANAGDVPDLQENISTVKQHRRAEPKVGRNDPCPCGSGKKYKQCHGKN